MNRRTTKHLLVIAGIVASLLAAVWSTVGFVLYGDDMTPNLIAELTGVSVEVAVAALVVDRLMSTHQRRQWDFAYRALAERSSEAFVDVMRLVYSGSSPAAVEANVARYGNFVRLAERHLSDFRSHIEGSATALAPQTYEQYRRVERRLAWCFEQLHTAPAQADDHSDLIPLLRETAVLSFELLSMDGDGHRTELALAESSVGQARGMNSKHIASSNMLDIRLRAQSTLLRELSGERGTLSSIGQDIDNNFSIPYFMIDYLLLIGVRDISKKDAST